MNLSQENWVKSIEGSKKTLILDVRTQHEFDEGHIEKSKNLDFFNAQLFLDEILKLNKELSIHIYCRSGSRSLQACELLKQMGFVKVFNLEGGIEKWNGNLIAD
tara:strand:+ start:3392 stop:3703 length:312 start_codon:yes stop_codon:yes gene_type:complete